MAKGTENIKNKILDSSRKSMNLAEMKRRLSAAHPLFDKDFWLAVLSNPRNILRPLSSSDDHRQPSLKTIIYGGDDGRAETTRADAEVQNIRQFVKRMEHKSRSAQFMEKTVSVEGTDSALVSDGKSLEYNGQYSEFITSMKHGDPLSVLKKRDDLSVLDGQCSGVGIRRMTRVSTFNCTALGSGAPITEETMNDNRQTLIRCSDCGRLDGSPFISETLSKDPNCQKECCAEIQSEQKEICICPADRMGMQCEKVREFRCQIKMTSPVLPCSAVDAPFALKQSLYSNPDCEKFSLFENQSIMMSFVVECSMKKPLVENQDSEIASKFSYYVRDGSDFALTQDPLISVQLKAFNFHDLSDDRQSAFSGVLSPNQLLGIDPIIFRINSSMLWQMNMQASSEMQVNYFTGGRLYVEAGFASIQRISGLQRVPYAKTFIDYSDYPFAASKRLTDSRGQLLPLWISMNAFRKKKEKTGIMILGQLIFLLVVSGTRADYLFVQDSNAEKIVNRKLKRLSQTKISSDSFISAPKTPRNLQLRHLYRYDENSKAESKDLLSVSFGRFDIPSVLIPTVNNMIHTVEYDAETIMFDPWDGQTILTAAEISQNAYHEPSDTSKWLPIDGYRLNISFGFEGPGLRGYVYADEAEELMIVGIKGTSASFFGVGSGPTSKLDKYTDNIMFSCCCAAVDKTWLGVCSCGDSSKQSCNSTCLSDYVNAHDTYVNVALTIYGQVMEMYPKATIWLTGHSLGGALAAIVGQLTRSPTITFEAPGERLFLKRLGHSTAKESDRLIWHFGVLNDPIFTGTCTGPTSSCYLAGYAMESQCHTGNLCLLDFDTSRPDIRSHRMSSVIDVIKNLLETGGNFSMAVADTNRRLPIDCFAEAEDCKDCPDWEFYGDFNT